MSKSSANFSVNTLLAGAGITLLVGLLAWALTRSDSLTPTSALLDKPASNFSVTALSTGEQAAQAQTLNLNDFRGRPLILNFWASWCHSCRGEAPVLEAFWQVHRDRIGVVGIAVQDSAEAVREYLGESGKSFPVGLDENGQASVDYGVTGVPETFFIDAGGVVRHKVAGPLDPEILAKMLAILLPDGDKKAQ